MVEDRAVSSIIVVLTVVVAIELVAVAAIGVYYLRSGKSSTGGFADMDVSISPGSQSGATGAKLTYIVTVTNIGNVSSTYSLGVDWGNLAYKISPPILSIKAGDSENATLTVTVGAVSEVMELYVTNATGTFGTTFTANVTGKELYALTTIVNGECSVVLNPAGEQYGPPIPLPRGVSTVGYLSGTVVTATATPSWGYEFDNWSGDASGTATSVTVTMNSDTRITANFRAPFRVDVSISPSSISGAAGANLSYTVTITNQGVNSDNYNLTINDTQGGVISLSDNQLMDVAPSENQTVTLSVTLGASGSDAISVDANSQGDNTVVGSASCTAAVTPR